MLPKVPPNETSRTAKGIVPHIYAKTPKKPPNARKVEEKRRLEMSKSKYPKTSDVSIIRARGGLRFHLAPVKWHLMRRIQYAAQD